MCPQEPHAPHGRCTRCQRTGLRSGAEWRGRGSFHYPPSGASQIGEAPGDAGESGANVCLGGGPLGALHSLALLLLASCVFVREKNTPRRCRLAAPLARARSLLLPLSLLLLPSLPSQTLDLNLLRIQHRGRRQAAGAAAEAAAAAQRDTAASRCTTPPAGSSSPPPPPCSSSQVPGDGGAAGGGAICGAGGAELPEQERRGGRRAQGGRRECELRARERGAGGVHARTHSHARSCLKHGLGSRSRRCEPVSWVRVCTALRCEALLLLRRGPRGINQLWSQG